MVQVLFDKTAGQFADPALSLDSSTQEGLRFLIKPLGMSTTMDLANSASVAIEQRS